MPVLEPIARPQADPGPSIGDEEAAALQRAVTNLFARWGLTDDQACTLLGGIGLRSYARWKAGRFGRAGVDLRTRLANLIAIHGALRRLFDDPNRAYAWIKKPNAAFGGMSALDVMLAGQITDILRVRRYLDAERGA